MPPSLFGSAKKGLPAYPYNPNKSKQLLQQAGLKLPVKVDFWYPTSVSRPYMPNPANNFQAFAADLDKAGFDVVYPEQGYGAVFAPVLPYPFTIRGTGAGVWVENILVVNPYNLIDFSTIRCDDHFVSGVEASVLNTGILVGGGSQHGRLERVLVDRGPFQEFLHLFLHTPARTPMASCSAAVSMKRHSGWTPSTSGSACECSRTVEAAVIRPSGCLPRKRTLYEPRMSSRAGVISDSSALRPPQGS